MIFRKNPIKRVITTTMCCAAISFPAFAQENYKKLADSLRYVTNVPYLYECNDPVLWHIVGKGLDIVPDLINKMTDTRKLEGVYVRFFGGEYAIADIAYTALQEIIAGIPTFDLLGVPFSEECGYCAYWWHVRASRKNRKDFQKAVRRWYEENKNNLVWVESLHSASGECFITPAKGYYVVKTEVEKVKH